jgi:hypothetical protein
LSVAAPERRIHSCQTAPGSQTGFHSGRTHPNSAAKTQKQRIPSFLAGSKIGTGHIESEMWPVPICYTCLIDAPCQGKTIKKQQKTNKNNQAHSIAPSQPPGHILLDWQ